MSDQTPTLYEQIGGEKMIDALVVTFYTKVFADPDLAPFFKTTPVERLHSMQKQFFTMATGGPPVEYNGRSLAHAHHGHGITAHHFARFTSHLLQTLLALGVTQADADQVVERVNVLANEVTGTSY